MRDFLTELVDTNGGEPSDQLKEPKEMGTQEVKIDFGIMDDADLDIKKNRVVPFPVIHNTLLDSLTHQKVPKSINLYRSGCVIDAPGQIVISMRFEDSYSKAVWILFDEKTRHWFQCSVRNHQSPYGYLYGNISVDDQGLASDYLISMIPYAYSEGRMTDPKPTLPVSFQKIDVAALRSLSPQQIAEKLDPPHDLTNLPFWA